MKPLKSYMCCIYTLSVINIIPGHLKIPTENLILYANETVALRTCNLMTECLLTEVTAIHTNNKLANNSDTDIVQKLVRLNVKI